MPETLSQVTSEQFEFCYGKTAGKIENFKSVVYKSWPNVLPDEFIFFQGKLSSNPLVSP